MDMIKKPKIWLIVLATTHTFLGVIGSFVQMGGDPEYLAVILYFLPVTVYLVRGVFVKNRHDLQRYYVLRLWYGSLS